MFRTVRPYQVPDPHVPYRTAVCPYKCLFQCTVPYRCATVPCACSPCTVPYCVGVRPYHVTMYLFQCTVRYRAAVPSYPVPAPHAPYRTIQYRTAAPAPFHASGPDVDDRAVSTLGHYCIQQRFKPPDAVCCSTAQDCTKLGSFHPSENLFNLGSIPGTVQRSSGCAGRQSCPHALVSLGALVGERQRLARHVSCAGHSYLKQSQPKTSPNAGPIRAGAESVSV